jgi:hypothetical protein
LRNGISVGKYDNSIGFEGVNGFILYFREIDPIELAVSLIVIKFISDDVWIIANFDDHIHRIVIEINVILSGEYH